MIKRTVFASLFALALAAGAAQAQAPLDGSAAADGNVVGGGSATLSGGGDNTTITYSTGGAGGGGIALLSQPGRLARFAGGHGDGQLVEYLSPAPAGAGREGWLLGGGDNAEVVYGRHR
jgi:hypothetical protein